MVSGMHLNSVSLEPAAAQNVACEQLEGS